MFDFENMLKELIDIDTVTPMETGCQSNTSKALDIFTSRAEKLGFKQLYRGCGPIDAEAPLTVQCMHRQMGNGFLDNQESLVLGRGDCTNLDRTVMFNFHIDTVGPHLPFSKSSRSSGTRYHGRGVIDNKGPGVAVLNAISEHLRANSDIGILLQVVSGEEGGAMGFYGTKHLFDLGYHGGLNVFVIPSGMKFFDRSTSSMTLELKIKGSGSTDDNPELGDNATFLLSSFVYHMAGSLHDKMKECDVKFTIAGMHTGEQHNRVYGQGRVLFNFSYATTEIGELAKTYIDASIKRCVKTIKKEFGETSTFKKSVDDLDDILQVQWLKRGLPCLSNPNSDQIEDWKELLSECGLVEHCQSTPAFTCDAIWGNVPGTLSIMFGPGELGRNGAHTDREYIDKRDLDQFTSHIINLLNGVNRR